MNARETIRRSRSNALVGINEEEQVLPLSRPTSKPIQGASLQNNVVTRWGSHQERANVVARRTHG